MGYSGITFVVSAITVGSGFLLHELGHKYVAQRYNAWAEFRSFDRMLLLAILMSFFGFIFAAPGAVFIRGMIDYKRNGKISAAGPLVNYVLALVFGALFFTGIAPLVYLGMFGFTVNAWLGLFNMIPLGNFDGVKILKWNKLVYGSMVGAGVVLVGLSFNLGLF